MSLALAGGDYIATPAVKVTFAILSSSASTAVLSQLVEVLQRRHRVVIHHDFGQQPDLHLEFSRCHVIPDYVPTGWGTWGQTQALLKLLRVAVQTTDFDYLQLLSESCLPIRPVEEFEDFLNTHRPDACIGLIPVGDSSDDIGRLNYGWRYLMHGRVKRRVTAVLANSLRDQAALRDVSLRPVLGGLAVVPTARRSTGSESILGPLRGAAFSALTSRAVGGHPYGADLRCFVGSTWFCLSRAAAEHVLRFADEHSSLLKHLSMCPSSDESIVQTAIGNSDFKQILDINHFLSWKQRATGPDVLGRAHAQAWVNSGKHFARKFSLDLNEPTRQEVLALHREAPRKRAPEDVGGPNA